MEEAIISFPKQFAWKPKIENAEKFIPQKNTIVCGMGGSHLATGILKMLRPGINLYVHRSYGLPPFDESFLKESLLVASSHSGNTEEVIDFLEEAYSRGLKTAVVATGGKLIEYAKENDLPFIQLPDTGIQPRTAVGYSLIAITKLLNIESLALEIESLEKAIDPENLKAPALDISKVLTDKIPVIYSSVDNLSIAYNWKIKMNETAKIPAFYNIFPELNHNEMTGFDPVPGTKSLSANFAFVFIKSSEDHPRIQKRMEISEKLYEERGFPVISVFLSGQTRLEKIINSILTADWVALTLSNHYKTESEQVPMVEEFKKRIAS